MTRSARAMIVAGLALVVCTTAGCAAPRGNDLGAAPAGGVGITAVGTGEVTGTPDIATIELGVATRAATAQAALAANNEQSTAVAAQLRAGGVADADVRTSQLAVNPTFDGTAGTITGYEVTNLVTVIIRDITAAGRIIDAAAQAAGDSVRVQQLSFAIDDASQLRAQARADAVRRAQEQARQLADAAGVSLGAIRSIVEVGGGSPPSPLREQYDGAAAAASAPVSPGTQELTVTVQIVYEIG